MSDSRFMAALRTAIEANGTSAYAVSQKAFRSMSTVRSWLKEGRSPSVENYEAALNAVGLTLKIVPLEEKA